MKTLLTTVLSFILISILYFYYLCDSTVINQWELRYYIFLVLITFILVTFGILRVYNAIVSQTRYLDLLKRDAGKFLSNVTEMNRIHEKLNTSFIHLRENISKLNNTNKKNGGGTN